VPSPDWVVFDLETTGLSPEWDRVIQIAAVRMRGGRVVASETFHSYVDPQRPIPPWIEQYTGVTDRHVRGAPPVDRVLAAFGEWSGDAMLVAHNGHRFDMHFLRAGCQRHALPTRPVAYHDSIWLSRKVWPEPRLRHGLDAVLDRLRLSKSSVRRHDARGDVELLGLALERMASELARRGVACEMRTESGVLPALAGVGAVDQPSTASRITA
jgi:DNA polymerase III epsilon subunit family exonuclease